MKRQAIIRALLESPWALQPTYLARIVDWMRSGMAEGAGPLVALDGPHDGASRLGGVATIPVYGVIEQRTDWLMQYFGGCSVDGIREQLGEALADPTVTAIVLEIDSPGGTVAGVTELAAEIRAARGAGKPIVVSINTTCGSAAAWLGLQADEVAITPSGHVGSIGVYALHQDISRMLDIAGITMTFISAGEHKTEGNEFEPLSDEARADIQARVDASYRQFVADVAAGRGTTTDDVIANYGGGRVLTAKDALAVGMVDRIESFGQTVQRLSKPGAAKRAIRALAATPALQAEAVPPPEGEPPIEVPDDPDDDAAEEPIEADQPRFTERITALADDANAVLGHAREKARLRAKEGRRAFSTTTETSLRAIRGAIDDVLGLVEPAEGKPPEQPVEPAAAGSSTPPAAAAPVPTRFRSRADWIRFLEAPTHR